MTMMRSRRTFMTSVAITLTGRFAWAQGTGARPATPSTGSGPEYRGGAPAVSRLWREGDPGTRLHLRGRVLSTTGAALEGASIELWQADGGGSYQPQRYRSALVSGRKGEFSLDTVVPGQYWGEKHIHVVVRHPAHQILTTRILFKGDPNLSPGNEDLAILLEEVHKDGEKVMVGNVELVLTPGGD